MTDASAAGAPLRADARRNRERILRAAQDAFAEEGRLVPLDEIARRARVGPGTVYRHFPTKEALFWEVVGDRIAAMTAEARRLAGSADPGAAFFGFFARVVERALFNHAVCEALADVETARRRLGGCAESDFDEALDVLLRRAQRAGAVRPDVDLADVRAAMTGCLAMERQRRAAGSPGRMVALVADALRPPAAVTKPAASNETSNETQCCEVCATPLAASPTGRPARYCSPACRQKAHRRRKAALGR
ncbi:TetR/AcrR family transcriptional regulator [Thermomonospora amylolytica]|uniref:TetR/AcrR family transcriptional regulator n=1 Tax=Thermomonospora amylolytica TaxID=1411117 RepID=UPI000E6B70E9|nr:TetR/AcrR family transcriptional regulator [Thermomonospora amylolytica]